MKCVFPLCTNLYAKSYNYNVHEKGFDVLKDETKIRVISNLSGSVMSTFYERARYTHITSGFFNIRHLLIFR